MTNERSFIPMVDEDAKQRISTSYVSATVIEAFYHTLSRFNKKCQPSYFQDPSPI